MTNLITKFEQVITNVNWLTIAKIALFVSLAGFSLYLVGISQIPAVHAAFHDVRHAVGFPCH